MSFMIVEPLAKWMTLFFEYVELSGSILLGFEFRIGHAAASSFPYLAIPCLQVVFHPSFHPHIQRCVLLSRLRLTLIPLAVDIVLPPAAPSHVFGDALI